MKLHKKASINSLVFSKQKKLFGCKTVIIQISVSMRVKSLYPFTLGFVISTHTTVTQKITSQHTRIFRSITVNMVAAAVSAVCVSDCNIVSIVCLHLKHGLMSWIMLHRCSERNLFTIYVCLGTDEKASLMIRGDLIRGWLKQV